MEWIVENWQWIALAVLVADKIVAATPTKYDDLILTVVKAAISPFAPKRK